MANYQEDLREQLRRKYEEKEHTVVKIALVGQPVQVSRVSLTS